VKDQQDALSAVDIAGIVTLRPVFQCTQLAPTGASTVPGATEAPSSLPTSTLSGTPSTTTLSSTPSTAPSTAVATDAADTTVRPAGFRRPASPAATPTTTPPTTPTTTPPTTPATTPTTTPGETVPGDTVPGDTTPVATPTATTAPAVVEPGDPAAPGQQTVLPVLDTGEVCAVGPTQGTGEVFSRGSAGVDIDQTGRWLVDVNLRDETTWNLLASQCFSGSSSCPSRQLAIVLDDVIQSAPVVNAPTFSGTVQITGQFSEGEARDLARVLNRGAFPVNVEAQSVQTVSPTLGEDSLRAAVFAGIVGIVVILLFLVAYYRRLAIVIVGGLIVWGMVVFSAAALVSLTTNYALTLAGVTGIIVAIGVTVDSYIVFFERMKDEVRGGRSLRNAAPRSFKATWKTIVAADVVSILGAAVLFWLSVGSVKGFALYLGITTVCDLIVCYFYTRPAVFLLTRRPGFDHATAIGVAAPVVTSTPSGATA
jgi:preprotein translocase subunit SecD